MKIASVTDVIYPYTIGGSEIRNHEVLKRLAKRGHEVHLFGAKLWDGPSILERDGITIHGLSRFDQLLGQGKSTRLTGPSMLAAKTFLALMKEKFDVIDSLAFVFKSCYAAKAVSVMKQTPLVLTWQQYFGDYFIGSMGLEEGKKLMRYEKKILTFSKFNIASSETVKRDLAKAGMPIETITTIYNGADYSAIHAAKPLEEHFDLIYVGRLVHQKNPELLLYTMNIIVRTRPETTLCIIGDGDKTESLKKLVLQLGISNNIVFKGSIADRSLVYRYMKSAKLFILPSLFEGFPLVVVEANACGLPLVVADGVRSRTREYVQNNGVMIEPTPRAMADAVCHLLENTAERSVMSEEGQKAAIPYDWDRIAEQTEAYYKKVSQKSRVGAGV